MNLNKLAITAAGIMLLSSCGGQKNNPEAEALLDQARNAYNAADYSLATTMLDSLQHNYPDQIELQKQGMALRPQVIEAVAIKQMAEIDSLTQVDLATIESLKSSLKWVKTEGMIEGYWIAPQAYNPAFMNSNGIEARVSEIGQFYLVSSLNPSKLNHTAVAVTIGGETARTPDVAYDGESNYRIGGGEVITFSPEQSDAIGKLAASFGGNTPAGQLTFIGKGNKKVALNQAQTSAIAQAYRYSSAVIRARDNAVERKRLEKTIETARRQAASLASRTQE